MPCLAPLLTVAPMLALRSGTTHVPGPAMPEFIRHERCRLGERDGLMGKMTTNERPRVDAGWRLLFTFLRARPRATQVVDHFERMFRFLTITLTAVALTGCCGLHDSRGPSSTCEAHLTAMRSVTVPGWGGCKLPTIPYSEARKKLFPHAGGDYMPSPWPWKQERAYLCDDCVRAKDEWIKNN